jgi:hypothetical protein
MALLDYISDKVIEPILGHSANDILTGGAESQGKAAEEAAAKQQELIEQMMAQQQAATNQALGALDSGYNAAQGYVSYGGEGALDTLNQGFAAGADALATSGQQATDAMTAGYQDAQGQMQQYGEQAAGAITGGVDAAGQSLNPAMALQSNGTALSDMLASGPYNNFTQDPGYQFRLQQGQDTIQHAASAAGGRHGGDTLKALSEYNQNFASNEFGNYVNRQNNVMGQMMGLAGMGNQAASQMAGMQYGAGGHLGDMYGGMGSQAGQMGMQYGQGMSGLYGMQGSQMADLLTGGAQAAAGQQNTNWQSMADLLIGQGTATANTLTGGAAGQANLMGQMLPTYAAGVPYAGAGAAAIQQGLMAGAMMYAGAPPGAAGAAGGAGGGAPAPGYGGYVDPYGYMY